MTNPLPPALVHKSGCRSHYEHILGGAQKCNCGAAPALVSEAPREDREVARIRKFWNKPPNPTYCSACKKEIQHQSGPAPGMFTVMPCPHCGVSAGWTSTFTTGGRDAKEDINYLLAALSASWTPTNGVDSAKVKDLHGPLDTERTPTTATNEDVRDSAARMLMRHRTSLTLLADWRAQDEALQEIQGMCGNGSNEQSPADIAKRVKNYIRELRQQRIDTTPTAEEPEAWALMLPEGVNAIEAKSLRDGRLLSDADCFRWVKFIDIPSLKAETRAEDVVCQHGTALDVHCCNCHSGFIFDAGHVCPPTLADAAEMLWVVLANVSGGDWTKQTPEWQAAAARWRDNYSVARESAIHENIERSDLSSPAGHHGDR